LVAQRELKAHVGEFAELFQKSERAIRKNQDGRTQCKTVDQVEQLFRARVQEALSPLSAGFIYAAADFKTDVAKKELADVLAAHTFAIASACDTSGTERFLLPCVRLSLEGHRRIIMTPMSDLIAFMKTQGVATESLYQVSAIKSFFSKMTAEQGSKYIMPTGTAQARWRSV
jgi:hypothetical protein